MSAEKQWKLALTHGRPGLPARYMGEARGEYVQCWKKAGEHWVALREGKARDEYPAHLVEVLT